MKHKLTSLILSLGFVTACGHSSDEENKNPQSTEVGNPTPSGSSIIADEELSKGALDNTMNDALEALADTSGLTSGAALALTENSRREKSCSAEDGVATVNITNSIDRSFSFDTRRRSYTKSVTGSSTLKRVWSDADGAVDCDNAGECAAIDWSADTTGLSLAVEFNRTHNATVSYENKINGNSYNNADRTFTANGTRNVTWTEQSVSSDNSQISRRKTVTSAVARTMSLSNSTGAARNIEVAVNTKEGADLVINSVRSADTLALRSKTIESGILVAAKTGDGYIETSFDNLTVAFDDSCHLQSGSVTASFYRYGIDGADDELVKSYTLVIEDGEFTFTNNTSGEEIADFELPGCALQDFQK